MAYQGYLSSVHVHVHVYNELPWHQTHIIHVRALLTGKLLPHPYRHREFRPKLIEYIREQKLDKHKQVQIPTYLLVGVESL